MSVAGDHDEALAAARRSVDLSEGRRGIDSGVAYAALGQALLALDRPVEAEAALRRAVAHWPRRRWIGPQIALARSLVRQARYEEGLAVYRALLEAEPNDDLTYLQRGLALLESGRYEAAVESFEHALGVLRHLDNEPILYTLLGETLHELGRYDAAAAHLDQALALDPGQIRLLLARVDLERERQRAAGLPAAAGDPSPERLSEAPPEAEAARVAAWLEEAKKRCEALIEQAPEHALVRVVLGAVLLRMEEPEAAVAALEEALALDPSRPVAREAHRVLGEVLERQRRIEAAASHYERALDIYPLYAEALERLGRLRFGQARYRDALPLYRRLVEVTPFVAGAHLHLGLTLHRLDRSSEALPVIERALSLDPALETARHLRAQVHKALAASPDLSSPRGTPF